MKQKPYIDIENIREEETDLKSSNTKAFEVGDLIQITEKFDGANASACWDEENDCMTCFSRNQELTGTNGLSGFKEYILTLPEKTKKIFKDWSHYIVFGEWSVKNKINYTDTGKTKHWYVFDIYNTLNQCWERQMVVKSFCKLANLEYIQELYYDKFISWEHCREFLHKNSYGDLQEGIVVKNQSKQYRDDIHYPKYLKIVNEEFKESMVAPKVKDLEKESEIKAAQEITDSIVTKNRVEKMLFKLRDEGILPEKIEPKDMKIVAQNLPKRIYEDCIKEEPELVKLVGEYFSKQCSSTAMRIAREIIL